MNSDGVFSLEDIDGKLNLVYQQPKYRPIPQTQSPTSSVEAASDDPSSQPLFFCPSSRRKKDHPFGFPDYYPFNSSPEYVPSGYDYHHVIPLFWCNNKDIFVYGCDCRHPDFGTSYYFCPTCQQTKHKECVESPVKIKHPYHPKHSLQLYYYYFTYECYCCGGEAKYLVYCCTICEIFMHPTCAMMSIPFVIDQPKRHDHPLTLFPRQTSLTCNVCGLLREKYLTYICLRCNFVAHKDCMYSPRIIKISRHHHRISFVSSLPSDKWGCGVCRQGVDGSYGAYSCDKCSGYAVHSRCALGKDVWDGEELEGVPEEDDLAQDDGPFDMISQGVILHFLHEHHHLQLKVSILYDEKEFCQACALPIYEGNFYSCMECHFILHETCAKARRRIQHGLHPHPLTLKAETRYGDGAFKCRACERTCGGFVYECRIRQCKFDLDIRCALISEPFAYDGHEHPLFLTIDPKEKPLCQVCESECKKQLNCIKCNFIVCFKCATLPYRVRYTHDTHFLTILSGKEIREKDWCEVCEGDLGSTSKEVFYWCNECSSIFHVECLIGDDPYMKPGQLYIVNVEEVQILGKSSLSRPVCEYCFKRCQGKIKYKISGRRLIGCSMRCMESLSRYKNASYSRLA